MYLDKMAHASFREGILSARADAPFRHNDVENLCDQIRQRGPGLVVADSVYSTHGTRCGLTRWAPRFAWRGARGLQLQPWVHAVTASLSKAFAGRGGLVACDPVLAESLRFTSVPAIFSSALHCALGEEHLHILAACAEIRDEVKLSEWRSTRKWKRLETPSVLSAQSLPGQ